MMLRRLVRSWNARVAVEGGSMRPALEPGDWLLVDPDAFASAPPEVGDLVLVPDPRQPGRLLVKRVDQVHDGGRELFVTGDAREETTDSWAFGSVSASTLEGRPWFRYWPPSRIGRVS
jgi:nickel-type superoxide dismutase maturation protease